MLSDLSFVLKVDEQLSDMSDKELKVIIQQVAEYGVVVFSKQNMDVSRFDYINKLWGIHRPADIWCSHPEFPNILRVTNKVLENGKKGLFHSGHLDWHCNGPFAPDPEECVALWCVQPSEKSITSFASGIVAYEALEPELQKSLLNTEIYLTNEIEKTISKRSAYHILEPHEQRDLDKMSSRNRDFAGGEKGNPYDNNKKFISTKRNDLPDGKKRRKDIVKKLVREHPVSGKKGLYFPYLTIKEFINKPKDYTDHRLYDLLVEVYVGAKGKIYNHSWEKGDLVVSDQILTIHKRNEINGERELYRTAFWYGTEK